MLSGVPGQRWLWHYSEDWQKRRSCFLAYYYSTWTRAPFCSLAQIDRRRQKELAEREALRSKSAEPCIGGGAAPARTDKKGQLEAMRRLSAVHSHYPEAEEDLLTSYM